MTVLILSDDKFIEKTVVNELERHGIKTSENDEDSEKVPIAIFYVKDEKNIEKMRDLRKKRPELIIFALLPYKKSSLKASMVSSGADYVMIEPIDFDDLIVRISFFSSATEMNSDYFPGRFDKFNRIIENTVKRMREEWSFSLELMKKLDDVSAMRDDETRDHTQRVGKISELLAGIIGMAPDEIVSIRLAAPLHDIGKIGIPDSILFKRGPLTEEEYEIMKTHTKMGAKLLESDFDILKCARKIALYHHERYDGTGYPDKLKGNAIPIEARIVTITDSFDAMVSKRPYKKAKSFSFAIDELGKNSGTQFDSELVEAFKSMIYTIEQLYKESRQREEEIKLYRTPW